MELGGIAAGRTSEENKGKADVTEQNVTSAKGREQEGIIKTTYTDSEVSEETGDGVCTDM